MNTGSTNLVGLAAFEAELFDLFGVLAEGSSVEALQPWEIIGDDGTESTQPLGNVVRFRRRPDAPRQMLLVGHYDTVFGAGDSFQAVTITDEQIFGPGVADMKGGLLVLKTALEQLEQSRSASDVGWELLFNPDEELGSVGSAPLLAAAAQGKDVGFIFEPSFPDGGLAGGRKGSGTFTVVVRGKSAHAGRDHSDGRNAVAALARITSLIDALNGRWDGVTINPGVVRGGHTTNIVPDVAVLKLNVRATTQQDADTVVSEIHRICEQATTYGITATLTGGFTRPPKPYDDRQRRLLEAAARVGRELGLTITIQETGGVSDGNNLYEAGLANIDNLGVHGANIHSSEEYMWTESLITRSQLATVLFLEFASGRLVP